MCSDFGEITLWIGVVISASNGFVYPAQWTALLSPLFVSILLIFVSGIPLLEAAANEKWQDDADYKHYKQTVPVLIPYVGRRGDAKF